MKQNTKVIVDFTELNNLIKNIEEIQVSVKNILLSIQYVEKEPEKANKVYSIEHIENVVCKYFKIDLDTLHKNTRKRDICQNRQIAMYLARRLTNLSLKQIGMKIGRKDHATTLYAFKNISNLIQIDKVIRLQVSEIEQIIKKL